MTDQTGKVLSLCYIIMGHVMKRTLFLISAAYVASAVVCLAILLLLPSFYEVGHLEQGCYLMSAMLPYAECNGFMASELAVLILNMPYLAVYLPVIGIAALGKLQVYGLLLAVGGLLLWMPVFIWSGRW